jgi:predicted  nucleic acid-binding Zn-ribbon protein
VDSKYSDLARINEKFKNHDYFSSDIVDTLNLEDMQARDAALVKENERLKMSIGVLEEEHRKYEGELERVREKCEKIRNEVEDD